MKLIDRALEEDIGPGDFVSNKLIYPGQVVKALVYTKQDCIVAGMELISRILKRFGISHTIIKKDGTMARKGDVLLDLNGNARLLLSLERTFMNILGRMIGIATKTHKLCVMSSVPICSTRKTAPGCLNIDRVAVYLGGGLNPRHTLYTSNLIRDKHLICLQNQGMSPEEAIRTAVKLAPKPAEIEVFSFEEAKIAAKTGIDIVVLDGFSVKKAAKTISFLRKRYPKVKISLAGGITERNLRLYSKLKPDLIFTSYLTVASKPAKIGLKILVGA